MIVSKIKRIIKSIFHTYYSVRIKLRRRPYRILLLLGHMRSGSSVFTHILTTNKEIHGFGENHAIYSKEKDFEKLILNTYWMFHKIRMPEKYVLDKVLHKGYLVNEMLLCKKNVYVIFLIREPEQAIVSRLAILYRDKFENNNKYQPSLREQEEEMRYYIGRLSDLENYAKTMNNKKRCLFITNEQLLTQTKMVFKKYSYFLN